MGPVRRIHAHRPLHVWAQAVDRVRRDLRVGCANGPEGGHHGVKGEGDPRPDRVTPEHDQDTLTAALVLAIISAIGLVYMLDLLR